MDIIKNSVVLITGADGVIGTALLEECIRREARKVYATGLKLENLNAFVEKYPNQIVPVELDVTKTESIERCSKICTDVTILINNAGVEFKIPFIAEKASQAALFEMKVNYIGVIETTNNFLPILEKAKNACIVNVLSMGSLVVVKRLGTYCASKAAAHLFTETIREELAEKSIKVMGAYMGYVRSKMSPEETKSAKAEPKDIAI